MLAGSRLNNMCRRRTSVSWTPARSDTKSTAGSMEYADASIVTVSSRLARPDAVIRSASTRRRISGRSTCQRRANVRSASMSRIAVHGMNRAPSIATTVNPERPNPSPTGSREPRRVLRCRIAPRAARRSEHEQHGQHRHDHRSEERLGAAIETDHHGDDRCSAERDGPQDAESGAVSTICASPDPAGGRANSSSVVSANSNDTTPDATGPASPCDSRSIATPPTSNTMPTQSWAMGRRGRGPHARGQRTVGTESSRRCAALLRRSDLRSRCAVDVPRGRRAAGGRSPRSRGRGELRELQPGVVSGEALAPRARASLVSMRRGERWKGIGCRMTTRR